MPVNEPPEWIQRLGEGLPRTPFGDCPVCNQQVRIDDEGLVSRDEVGDRYKTPTRHSKDVPAELRCAGEGKRPASRPAR